MCNIIKYKTYIFIYFCITDFNKLKVTVKDRRSKQLKSLKVHKVNVTYLVKWSTADYIGCHFNSGQRHLSQYGLFNKNNTAAVTLCFSKMSG